MIVSGFLSAQSCHRSALGDWLLAAACVNTAGFALRRSGVSLSKLCVE